MGRGESKKSIVEPRQRYGRRSPLSSCEAPLNARTIAYPSLPVKRCKVRVLGCGELRPWPGGCSSCLFIYKSNSAVVSSMLALHALARWRLSV